jgi:hypothetical protein
MVYLDEIENKSAIDSNYLFVKWYSLSIGKLVIRNL